VILGRTPVAGHVALLHADPERGEAIARLLRSAGHRVTLVERGRRVVQAVVERAPDLLVISAAYPDPPVPAVVRGVRQALGHDLPILVLVAQDDPELLIEADEMVREPVDAAELDLRVGSLLRARADRRLLQRKVQELLGLYKISWAFSLAGGAEALYGHLARQSAEVLKAEKGLVLLFDRERRQMVAQHQGFGVSREQVSRVRYAVDGEPRSRWNFRKNGPLMSNKAQADSRLLAEITADLDLHSVLVAPMTRGPQVHGLLVVADRVQDAPFNEEDLNLLLAVAGQATVAVENLRLHEELKRANALLQEYDRLKSEFVAIVAHDFRKPLMAIRGFAELVLEEPDIPLEARQEFMRTVINETEHLALLANDTMLITQIETGEFEFRWSEIDLGPFVLDTMPLGLSDHSVLLDIPPDFPRIVADADRLRQVLTNLTMNAVKYSPGGGSITVRCRERGTQHVVIEVDDHGLGIPQEQIGHLFQKFQRVRTEEHLKISGTGLGLYICRLIVEGHGGQIWVESELGKGSTFGLVLPVDARTARKARKAQMGEAQPAPAPPAPEPE
jgi:signal transduction histidine kinase/DNA-binding response OmpR family regulator